MGASIARAIRLAIGTSRRQSSMTLRVYSYVVAHDSGFAPNPFHGMCTLACCKPRVRAKAGVGDIVVGLTRGAECVVYAMWVDEVVTFDDYWSRPEFTSKRPGTADEATMVGDNIYEPNGRGGFRQLPSGHSNPDGLEDPDGKARDMSSQNVLVSRRFSYFGRKAAPLPEHLTFLRIGRNHRSKFSRAEIALVAAWFAELPDGKHGDPHNWPPEVKPWMGTGSGGGSAAGCVRSASTKC